MTRLRYSDDPVKMFVVVNARRLRVVVQRLADFGGRGVQHLKKHITNNRRDINAVIVVSNVARNGRAQTVKEAVGHSITLLGLARSAAAPAFARSKNV